MAKYLYGQDALVADFVARAKRASGFAPYAGFTDRNLRAIGITNNDGELIAGIVYFNWFRDYGHIELSIEALPKQNWLTRKTLAIMFQYPFWDCGCQMVITRISEKSQHIRRMLEAMNFEHVRLPRMGGRHEDALHYFLTYERWVDGKFCRRFGHHIPQQIEKVA